MQTSVRRRSAASVRDGLPKPCLHPLGPLGRRVGAQSRSLHQRLAVAIARASRRGFERGGS